MAARNTRTTSKPADAPAPEAAQETPGPDVNAENYEPRQDHGAYRLLARREGADGKLPLWLVQCTKHGTTTPAANATTDGRAKGRASERATWCAGCKADAKAGRTRPAASTLAGQVRVVVKLAVTVDKEAWAATAEADAEGEPIDRQGIIDALRASGIPEDRAVEIAESAVVPKPPTAADIREDVRTYVLNEAAKLQRIVDAGAAGDVELA